MDDLSRFFAGSTQQNGFAIPMNTQTSSLILVRQTANSEDTVNKNGVQKKMYIVVKNSPFIIEMALSATVSPGSIDLSKVAFEGSLAYDSDSPGSLIGKDVDFIKVKPMEFKVLSSNTQTQHVECEARIKVLTSQHEGALFRLRIQGHNPITRQEIPGLTLYSNPIKVISKPEPSSKKKQTAIPSSSFSAATNSSSSTTTTTTTTTSSSGNVTGHKRKSSPTSSMTSMPSLPSATLSGFQTQHPVQQGDLLLELIQRIEKQQEEQQRILFQLLKQQPNENNNSNNSNNNNNNNNNNSSTTTTTTTTSSSSSSRNETEEPSSKRQKIEESSNQQQQQQQQQIPLPTTSGLDDMFLLVTKEPFNFEEAFQHLIRSYILLTPEEKPEMIRRLIRGMSVRDTERVQEMLDLFWSEGLQRELGGESVLGFGGNQQSQCNCKDCPYRAPSEDLYRDLFTGTPSNTLQSPASTAQQQQNF